VFFAVLLSSLDNFLNFSDLVILAEMKAFHHRSSLKDVLKLLQVNLLNARGAEVLL